MLDLTRDPALQLAAMPPERTPAPPAAMPGIGWIDRNWRLVLVLLVVATFLVRARYFGNPLIDADEQFYLLTGDRMLHGAIPYTDIWDRKPVGLFVLYAAIRLLGGDGVIEYQIVAACFAAATAVLIATIARRITTPGAALVAALSYAPALALSGGQGGQTPVFYNLLVTAAAALVLGRFAPRGDARTTGLSLRWFGAGVMLLIGVAIQIKYNAVFEGVYFGLVLLALAWRADPRPGALLLDGLVWIAAALAPTVLAYLVYIAIGQRDAFEYAIRSIFSRAGVGPRETLHNLGHDAGRLAPYLVAILLAEGIMRRHASWRDRPGGAAAHLFLAGWAGAAAAGFLIFGTYFNHYVLPLIAPLAIIAAPAFAIRRRRIGAISATLLLVTLAVWFLIYARKTDAEKGTAPHAYEVAARIRPMLKGGCLFIFYGEPIYYQLTNSCLLTRWPFPYHLSLAREAAALGVDPAAELRRILAQKPPVVLNDVTDDPEVNRAIERILRAELNRDYRLVYSYTLGGKDPEQDQLWERIPGR